MSGRETRLAIVLSHPTQYYSPWFRWLRAETDLAFRVFYLWQFGVQSHRDPQFQTTFKWDVDLLAGYEHEFVPNTAADPGTHHFRGLRNPTLCGRLATWSPDAVLLFGYKWETHLRVIAWARRRRLRLLFRGDSHLLGRGRPSPLARVLLRSLYRRFDAFLAVGAANRDYFRAFGVSDSKIFFAPHAVNHTLFDPDRADHQSAAREQRVALGISNDTRVILFAGKLVPAKQPRGLLEAFITLRPQNAALVFVGDGSEKACLQSMAAAAKCDNVHFLPFTNQSEMPARYLLADIFVLPSRGHYETWGLAVNEAMHMGVPPLVSNLVGCQQDLVTDGETGWVCRVDQPEALGRKLAESLVDVSTVDKRKRLRKAVTERIARYTYARTTEGLLAALQASAA